MRHRVSGRKFSRHSKHRELMFRNMLVSLFDHERIQTTLAKAKELRGLADRMITLAKKGSLHARRQAFALLRNEDIVKKLFDQLAPRFKERPGGYTRIYRMGWRAGDAAPLSLIELVSLPAAKETKKSAVKKAKEAIKKVVPKKKEAADRKGKEKGKQETKAKAVGGPKKTKATKESKAGGEAK
jgi:large subunit ribosomal protein L17